MSSTTFISAFFFCRHTALIRFAKGEREGNLREKDGEGGNAKKERGK